MPVLVRAPRRRILVALLGGGVLMATAEALAYLEAFPGAGWSVVVAALLSGLLAVAAGLTRADLGLDRAGLRTGARWSAVIVAAACVIVAVGVAVPVTRELFLNDRYTGLRGAIWAALVWIPLRTVLAEELFFRGVLLGGLVRLVGTRRALLVGSLLFGLWHVATSLNLTNGNRGLRDVFGGGPIGQVAGVIAAAAVTSVAGFVLGWLRLRSGSLLTPVALHWAVNGAGAIGAAAAWQLTR
ncbi:CPBP family intramembrane metalloprotease [Gordonia sinesedis]